MFGLTWLGRFIVIGSVLFAAALVILTSIALTKESYQKSGLFTITFDSEAFLKELNGRSSKEGRDLFQSLGAKVTDVAEHVETGIPALGTNLPEVVDRVSSAAKAVATGIPSFIEDTLIPRNFTIGTDQFCIGRSDDVTCHQLPPDVSMIIPNEIREKVGFLDDVDLFSSLGNIKKFVFQHLWIIGLVLVLIAVGMTVLTVFGRFIPGFRVLRMVLFFLTSVACVSLYLVPVVIFAILRKKADSIPSWLEVSHGDVPTIFTAGFCCVVVIAALGGLVQFVI